MSFPGDPRDEAFWKAHERVRERRLGQPCCTQSGVSWSLADMDGNFTVVIHGVADCAAAFHHHTGRSVSRYLTTRLQEADLVGGRSDDVLRDCLVALAREERPEIVFVLGTCPVEVVGARFEGVVEAVSRETGVPMVALRTHGLGLVAQTDMLDGLYESLVSLPVVSTAAIDGERAPGVAFVGLPPTLRSEPEPVSLLRLAAIPLVSSVPAGATLEAWRALGTAAVVACVDRARFPRLVRRLEGFGRAVQDVPMPIGLEPTLALYEGLSSRCEGGERLSQAVAPRREAAAEALERARRAFRGARVGVAVRTLNSYRAEMLAHGGLAEARALREMGFDVQILVQGSPDPDAERAFAETLERDGTAFPFAVFPGAWAVGEALAGGRFDLVSVDDQGLHAAIRLGIPAVPSGGLSPYLVGVHGNAAMLSRMLRRAT